MTAKNRQPIVYLRGAATPIVAVIFPVTLILASFVVNQASIELTNTELRIVADSAARAARWTLNSTESEPAARTVARDAADRNLVAGEIVTLTIDDIEFGISSHTSGGASFTFQPGVTNPNAVRVSARHAASSASRTVSIFSPASDADSQFEPDAKSTSDKHDES